MPQPLRERFKKLESVKAAHLQNGCFVDFNDEKADAHAKEILDFFTDLASHHYSSD